MIKKSPRIKKKTSISMMVAAYNEEENLKSAVTNLSKILSELFEDYEIIIFDDNSTDKTPKIADTLAKNNDRVMVVHNKINKGLGYNYRTAVKLAKKDYFSWIPGDDDVDHESIRKAMRNIGKSDIIVPYISNQHERPLLRRFLSLTYVFMLNVIFNLRLKYYNGFVICKTKILKKIPMTTSSFAFQSEVLIRLIKKGYSYTEIPYCTVPQAKTSAFRIKNLIGVAKTVYNLFFSVNFKKIKK